MVPGLVAGATLKGPGRDNPHKGNPGGADLVGNPGRGKPVTLARKEFWAQLVVRRTRWSGRAVTEKVHK